MILITTIINNNPNFIVHSVSRKSLGHTWTEQWPWWKLWTMNPHTWLQHQVHTINIILILVSLPLPLTHHGYHSDFDVIPLLEWSVGVLIFPRNALEHSSAFHTSQCWLWWVLSDIPLWAFTENNRWEFLFT